MRILLDTNIIVNYLTRREDQFTQESIVIMHECANGRLDGFVAIHSLSSISYVFRKLPFEIRLNWLKLICETLNVASANSHQILKGLQNQDFKDIEDNLQDCCAQSIGADYIVTANVRDYEGHSVVKAVTPAELLDIMNKPNDGYSCEVHESQIAYHAIPVAISRSWHQHFVIHKRHVPIHMAR